MQRLLVSLRFQGPLHADGDAAEPLLHSDTLASALLDTLFFTGQEDRANALLDAAAAGKTPLRLSSAFPFSREVLYLPAPRTACRTSEPAFLPWPRFAALARGEPSESGRSADPESFACADERSRQAQDRLSGAGAGFSSRELRFAPDAGLYFLADLDEKVLPRRAFEQALALLGREGLGGGRSAGAGAFDLESRKLPEGLAELFAGAGDAWVTLSLFHPGPDVPADLGPLAYKLVPRGGRIASASAEESPLRKTTAMFAEGSVFRTRPQGAWLDVTPAGFDAHRVWRCGVAYSCPIRLGAR